MKSIKIIVLLLALAFLLILQLFSEFFLSIYGFNDRTLLLLIEIGFSMIFFLTVFLIIYFQNNSINKTKQSERMFRKLFDSANDAIYLFELTEDGMPGRFIEVNKITCDRFGFSREELLTMTPLDITSKERRGKVAEIQNNLLKFGKFKFEGEYVDINGYKIPSEIHVSLFKEKTKNYAIAISRDISDRKKAEELVFKMAYYDLLTGLPNRRLFEEQLAITLSTEPIGSNFHAFMFIDLDGFKQINDAFGHDVGDCLLQAVSLRLKEVVRNNDDIVSRHAGDEFTILLPNITQEDTKKVAQRILTSIQVPVMSGEHILHASCSIGISFSSTIKSNPETLLRQADLAMYKAKYKGKNNYHIYDGTKVLKDTKV